MVIAFAPALGPTISGLLVEWLSWRWMFALLVAIAGGVIAAACFTVHNVGEPTHPHIDVLSVVLSTFGFGGVLFGFSTAGGNGWGSMDVLLVVVAVCFAQSTMTADGGIELPGAWAIIMIIGAYGFFLTYCATWGVAMWVVIGEIFPNRIRAVAVALATAANWIEIGRAHV